MYGEDPLIKKGSSSRVLISRSKSRAFGPKPGVWRLRPNFLKYCTVNLKGGEILGTELDIAGITVIKTIVIANKAKGTEITRKRNLPGKMSAIY